MLIEYKGRTLESKFFCEELTHEFCNQMRQEYYTKPDKSKVVNNLIKVSQRGVKITEIERYYFKDLMAKTCLYHSKWSIEEVLECDDLIKTAFGKIQSNNKVYNGTDIKNLETYFRIGGKGVASKPTNFPIKTVDEILSNYNVNNNYYDFSCGWGVRLLGAMRNKVNYYGTDPNYLLTERLEEMKNDYKENIGLDTVVDIRTQGSEFVVEEWKDKMGLAFSSPPYFGLEDYKVGEQSYKEGMNYEEWKNGYYINTLKNIYNYLIKGGYLAININNYNKFNLVEDTMDLCIKQGFKYITTHELKNISRIKSTKELNSKNNEGIMIFQK